MWMKYTRVTSVSATVLQKHKYLTALAVTPSDRVIAAAQELAKYIKGRMTHHLIYTILDHKERLGTILKQHMPQTDATSTTLSPPPISSHHPTVAFLMSHHNRQHIRPHHRNSGTTSTWPNQPTNFFSHGGPTRCSYHAYSILAVSHAQQDRYRVPLAYYLFFPQQHHRPHPTMHTFNHA